MSEKDRRRKRETGAGEGSATSKERPSIYCRHRAGLYEKYLEGGEGAFSERGEIVRGVGGIEGCILWDRLTNR